MTAYTLLVIVHVLLFAYWLGADWGVYVNSRYVADFIGDINLLEGRIAATGGTVRLECIGVEATVEIDQEVSAEVGDAAWFAVTDHDTVEGIPEAEREAKAIGIELVPGIEVSANHGDAAVHVLGLFIQYREPWLERFFEELRGVSGIEP